MVAFAIAPRRVSYLFFYERPSYRCALRRLCLDHTSLAKASEGFVANGVLSNRCLALVTLTGFRLGAAFARFGMPPQVRFVSFFFFFFFANGMSFLVWMD